MDNLENVLALSVALPPEDAKKLTAWLQDNLRLRARIAELERERDEWKARAEKAERQER